MIDWCQYILCITSAVCGWRCCNAQEEKTAGSNFVGGGGFCCNYSLKQDVYPTNTRWDNYIVLCKCDYWMFEACLMNDLPFWLGGGEAGGGGFGSWVTIFSKVIYTFYLVCCLKSPMCCNTMNSPCTGYGQRGQEKMG